MYRLIKPRLIGVKPSPDSGCEGVRFGFWSSSLPSSRQRGFSGLLVFPSFFFLSLSSLRSGVGPRAESRFGMLSVPSLAPKWRLASGPRGFPTPAGSGRGRFLGSPRPSCSPVGGRGPGFRLWASAGGSPFPNPLGPAELLLPGR